MLRGTIRRSRDVQITVVITPLEITLLNRDILYPSDHRTLYFGNVVWSVGVTATPV